MAYWIIQTYITVTRYRRWKMATRSSHLYVLLEHHPIPDVVPFAVTGSCPALFYEGLPP